MKTKLGAGQYLRLCLVCLSACAGSADPNDGTNTLPTGMVGVPGAAAGGGTATGAGGTNAPGVNNTSGTGTPGAPGGAGTAAMQPGMTPGTISGGTGAPPATTGGSGGPSTVDPNVGKRGRWMSFGGNNNHTRASENESIISASNAAMLGTAFDIKAPGVTSTPAVYDGVVYWGDWGGTLHATEIPTGTAMPKDLWTLDKTANKGGYSGSPALTDTLVVAANRNGLVTAVDRVTGKEVWEHKLDAGPHTYIWSSAVVAAADGVVVVGIGGAGTRDNGVSLPASQLATFHGAVVGISLADGKQMWRFETSPEPSGAGVSVWSSGALDETRKLVFIGTGNNYARPTSERCDSLLAIDYMTGTEKWHYQFTANDAFTTANFTGGIDGDVGATPNLFKIGEKDVVGVGDKPAGYHVFDRDTGDIIWENENLTSDSGFQGGILQPATVADGKVFVISNNGTLSSTLFAFNQADGAMLFTAPVSSPMYGGSAYGNGVLYTGDSDGNIKAFDASNGNVLWMTRAPAGIGGGFSLVDGLLFVGYGHHFSQSAMEPLNGGLMGFAIGGSAPPPPTGPTSDCVADTAVTAAPTFTNVYQGVLCANGCDKVCHTSNTGAAQLGFMSKSVAYTNLVGTAAMDMNCAGKGSRVVAGNPDMSILYQKMAGVQTCGDRMPPGGPMGGMFPQAQLDALKAWIMAGAPND
jgi:polyvinyl alcohol dehydrogenase (cytochrome)